MTEPGSLLARGRAADVFSHGPDLVLRRYRSPYFTLPEAALMQWVRAHGYPAPEVVTLSGMDMVMERVDGPTMLADIARRPWRLRAHAAALASLMKQLHSIPAPGWLEPRLGNGDAIVHLDLHPDNVIVAADGPVVIDWTNAGRGDPLAEVADLWLLMSSASAPGGPYERSVVAAGRKLFLRSFLSHFDLDAVRSRLRLALEHRMRDRNITSAERARMEAVADRFG